MIRLLSSTLFIICFEFVIILLLMFNVYQEKKYITNLNNITENRFKMLDLADQLRQSSDDLTHFARTYVVTNNNQYKEQYLKTLAIRNGESPRPYNYNAIYWDLEKNIREERHPLTAKLALKDMMKELPYLENELNKMILSESQSNELVDLEVKAFKAMHGDSKDQNYAISLLHSSDYYQAKSKIMAPIDELIILIDERTKKEIDIENNKIIVSLNFFYLILFIFMFGNILIYFALTRKEKLSKDHLNKLNLNLENKVKERTKELSEERNRANNAVKSKSEFLANMSHEIRTPLNAITGFIDILKDENKNRKSLEYIEIIDDSSKSLLQIIEDILDFSKIESGKLNIDKIDFNPKDEFKIIIDLFSGKCSQKNINLNVSIATNLPSSLNTDPLRIKQVIANLLSNAIKFSSNNKTISVDISYVNDSLNVSVKDEGIGISSEKINHIFEAFNQEDTSTTRKYGGTGLGLSISRELIKLLGGQLQVKSKLGEGSEFYFNLPVKTGKDITKNKIEEITKDFSKLKLLLVEDNKSNQIFMKVVLRKLNIEFSIANDGLEALGMFKENSYDIVLMDENMPNMNGIEATKHILKYEKSMKKEHTPIIALTANALKNDRERFLTAGMDEYLCKPLDKNQLCILLDEFTN